MTNDTRAEAMFRTQANKLMHDFADCIPALLTKSGQLGLLGSFLAQDRDIQQSIVNAFTRLMRDWYAGKPVGYSVDHSIDHQNEKAWGFAKLVHDLSPDFIEKQRRLSTMGKEIR